MVSACQNHVQGQRNARISIASPLRSSGHPLFAFPFFTFSSSRVLMCSTHHQIGSLVVTVTRPRFSSLDSGTIALEVDTKPLKDDGVLSLLRRQYFLLAPEIIGIPKFHFRPVVVNTLDATPTGSSPHVGPTKRRSRSIW